MSALTLGTRMTQIATSWYWRQVYRLVSMIRGALVMAISEKSLRLHEDPDTESRATTLMTSDVQRIVSGTEFIHEIWAGAIETALATYLLYRIVGISCVTMPGLALGKAKKLSKFARSHLPQANSKTSRWRMLYLGRQEAFPSAASLAR